MSHLCSSVTCLSTTTCWRVSCSPIPHCHRPTSPTSAFVNQRALHLLPCAIHHTFLSQHLSSGGELSNEVHFRISSGSVWATFSHSHHTESYQRLLDCLSTKGREDWRYLFPHRCSCFFPSQTFQVEYDGLTGRVEFNSKGQRTNYTLRILEKHRGGHKEVWGHWLWCSSQVTQKSALAIWFETVIILIFHSHNWVFAALFVIHGEACLRQDFSSINGYRCWFDPYLPKRQKKSSSEISLMKFIEDHLWITADTKSQMCILLAAGYPWWNQLWGFLVWMNVAPSSVSFCSTYHHYCYCQR